MSLFAKTELMLECTGRTENFDTLSKVIFALQTSGVIRCASVDLLLPDQMLFTIPFLTGSLNDPI
jgi:hypothetical protein